MSPDPAPDPNPNNGQFGQFTKPLEPASSPDDEITWKPPDTDNRLALHHYYKEYPEPRPFLGKGNGKGKGKGRVREQPYPNTGARSLISSTFTTIAPNETSLIKL